MSRYPIRNLRSSSMRTILLIVAILLVLGALPTWPYSSNWGYYPSLTLIVLAIIAVFVMLRRAPR
jgi:hypothetical protein